MRHTLLLAPFALQASALLGRRSGPVTPQPSSTTPSTTTTSSSTSTSVHPTQETDNTALCHNGFTQQNWKKYNMDYYMDHWSNTYPQTREGTTVSDGTDWVHFLADMTGSLSNVQCEVASQQCDLGATDSISACSKDPEWTPLLFFALQACENLFDWYTGFKNVLETQAEEFQTQVMGIVDAFTSHDVSGDSASAVLSMIGGLLGAFSGILGPLEGVTSGGLGAASGITAFANGAQVAMQGNAAALIQNEINTYSDVESVVGNAIVVMQNASMMVVENAINAVPDNNPEGAGYGYGSWEAWHSSAPYIMQGGTFAEELPNAAYNVLSGEVTKYINSSAVAAAWITQGVFVAKRTDSINGNSPCDISLDKLDGARACSSDGSTAYFWMLSQTLTPSYAWGDYQGVPGVSNVGNYGLDLYEMAESADWLNSAYGSYLPQPSVQDIYTDLTSSDPIPNGLFINVPVMSADGLSPPDLYDQGGAELGDEALFIVEVLDQLLSLGDWPYSLSY